MLFQRADEGTNGRGELHGLHFAGIDTACGNITSREAQIWGEDLMRLGVNASGVATIEPRQGND
jgi:hypothetical protein